MYCLGIACSDVAVAHVLYDLADCKRCRWLRAAIRKLRLQYDTQAEFLNDCMDAAIFWKGGGKKAFGYTSVYSLCAQQHCNAQWSAYVCGRSD